MPRNVTKFKELRFSIYSLNTFNSLNCCNILYISDPHLNERSINAYLSRFPKTTRLHYIVKNAHAAALFSLPGCAGMCSVCAGMPHAGGESYGYRKKMCGSGPSGI